MELKSADTGLLFLATWHVLLISNLCACCDVHFIYSNPVY